MKIAKRSRTGDGESDCGMISRVTKTCFGKVKRVRKCVRVKKCEQARDEMVMDVNGKMLRDGVEVRRRWAEYFLSLYGMWQMLWRQKLM